MNKEEIKTKAEDIKEEIKAKEDELKAKGKELESEVREQRNKMIEFIQQNKKTVLNTWYGVSAGFTAGLIFLNQYMLAVAMILSFLSTFIITHI